MTARPRIGVPCPPCLSVRWASSPLAVPLLVTGSPAARTAALRAGSPGSGPEAPNVIVMMLDDATVDDVEQMPNVQRLLADQGVTFTSFWGPFPQCCPARASALTGRNPHNHRVLDIKPPFGGFDAFDDRHTIATYLDPGYRTGIFGKYLNGFDDPVGGVPGLGRLPGAGARCLQLRRSARSCTRTGPSRTSRATCRPCTRTR